MLRALRCILDSETNGAAMSREPPKDDMRRWLWLRYGDGFNDLRDSKVVQIRFNAGFCRLATEGEVLRYD